MSSYRNKAKYLLAATGIITSCMIPVISSSKPATPVSAAIPDAPLCSESASDRTLPNPIGYQVLYFVNVRNGDKVHSPFRVVFGVSGMGVSPVAAGKIDGTGHHHILIDSDLPPNADVPIPFDKPNEYLHQHYKHYGNGETEALLNLPPGKHRLRLMFANHLHIPYYMASREISVEVLPTQK